MNSRRSWIVFAAGVTVYFVAVLQRTSFGIAGVDATNRFGVTAASISLVAVVQVAVYAGLQIPVGIVLDRLGPRRLIVAGAALMGVGQLVLAFAPNLGLAVVARVLCGAGDAMIFISVVRVLPAWFEGRMLSQLVQWLGMLGQIGQLLSAFPFALLLHGVGWTPAFVAAAGASAAAALAALALIPAREPPLASGPLPTGSTLHRLRASLSRPGTQLGFWAHLVAGHTTSLMNVMWGYPFLLAGLGLPPAVAAGIFSLMIVGSTLPAPVVGLLAARFPLRRSNVVFGITILIYAIWAVVLLWPGVPPLWLVGALFVAFGVGGPGSLVGLDFARSFNPSHAVGTASGIVNAGGFLGAFVGMFFVGLVLDLVDSARVAAGGVSDLYALDSFRIAFLVPFAVTAIGLVGFFVTRTRTRRHLSESEGIEVAPLWVSLIRTWRGRRPGV